MAAIKVSSKVDAAVWEDLKELADESHQNISGLLTEAESICSDAASDRKLGRSVAAGLKEIELPARSPAST